MSWKSTLKPGYIEALRLSGVFARARRYILAKNGTIVLTFHRVLPPEAMRETFSPRGMIVAEPTFEVLVQYLQQEFQVVSLSDALTATSSKPKVAITFDDGWRDTAEIAAPILRQAGLPAGVFVCSDRMGMRNPFWPETALRMFRSAQKADALPRLYAACVASAPRLSLVPGESEDDFLEQLKELSPVQRRELLRRLEAEFAAGEAPASCDETMSWEQMDALARSGVVIGSHTANHEILTSVPETELYPELTRSRSDIAARLCRGCVEMSYPNGSWSGAVRNIVARCGYERAYINSPGILRKGADLLAIPRVNVWEGKITDARGRFSATAFEYSIVRCAANADRECGTNAQAAAREWELEMRESS